MNVRENLIRRIKDTLAIYAVRIDLDKGEASRAAENFYCGLLNILKGYDLRNMNLEKPNYPAIDLGDAAEGLGVQVTSTATRQKVQDTLDAMFRNGVQTEYPHLVMLITKEWRDSRKAFRMDGACRFDPNADIWDTNWLLAQLDGIEALEKLEEIRDYLTKHLHLVREPAPALNLPLQSAMAEGAFVGREKELAEIAKRFETEHIVVLSGLGGMGKTELAVKFGREYQESGRGWAYFLHFSGSFGTTLRSNMHRIIPDYSMTGKTDAQIEADALAALNQCGKEDLLVLDNANEGSFSELMRELSTLRMRVLVTSRHRNSDFYKLEAMKNEQLYRIFERHRAKLDKEMMDKLIDVVDGHTMTVDLIARTLGSEWCITSPEEIRDAMAGADLPDDDYPEVETDHERDPEQLKIYGHLRVLFQFQKMEQEEENALRCAVLLPADGMKMELFLKALPRGNRKAIRDLSSRGWIQCEEKLVTIHPVVRLVCRKELGVTEEQCGAFLNGLSEQYDPNKYDKNEYRQMAEVFTTATKCLEDTEGKWALPAGHLWWKLGESVKALECNKELVRKREEHGSKPEDLALAYNNLAGSYGDVGDHRVALEYNMKALEIRKQVLPVYHYDLAQSYNNVGTDYMALGNFDMALVCIKKAVVIVKRVVGVDNSWIATSFSNIGSIYGEKGDQDRALKYKLKALKIWKKILPEDHPSLATCYNNVASTYGALGNHERALEYGLKALHIMERMLPADHPDLATACGNIAAAYAGKGDYKTAMGYINRAVEIAERRFPEGHPVLENYRYGARLFERLAMLKEKEIEVPNPFKK